MGVCRRKHSTISGRENKKQVNRPRTTRVEHKRRIKSVQLNFGRIDVGAVAYTRYGRQYVTSCIRLACLKKREREKKKTRKPRRISMTMTIKRYERTRFVCRRPYRRHYTRVIKLTTLVHESCAGNRFARTRRVRHRTGIASYTVCLLRETVAKRVRGAQRRVVPRLGRALCGGRTRLPAAGLVRTARVRIIIIIIIVKKAEKKNRKPVAPSRPDNCRY